MLLKTSTKQWALQWRRPDAKLASINGEPISVSAWLQDIAVATRWLNEQEGDALLYQRDWYRFSVWFFALLESKKRIILPANDKPATLSELSSQYAFRVPQELPSKGRFDAPSLTLKGDLDSPLIFFTSGSSGKPKAVEKTLRQLWLEVNTLEQTFADKLGQTDILATVTHQHIYGLLFTVLWPLAAGRSVTLPLIDYPEQLQQLLAKADGRRYALVSSPAHLQRLDNLLQLAQHKSALTMVFSSGGPLPGSVAKNFADNELQAPIEVYGSTETGGIAWRQRNPGASDSFEPLAGIEVSSDNNDLLVIQSPYLKEPQRPYTTEDKVQLQGQGCFLLLGRQDRITKIAEKRVSLDEVEQFIQQHEWIESAKACVLHSHRVELGLVLVLNSVGNAELNTRGRFKVRQELRHHLQQRFEKVIVPKRFRYVAQLPYNGAGKVTQADLQALFEEEK